MSHYLFLAKTISELFNKENECAKISGREINQPNTKLAGKD